MGIVNSAAAVGTMHSFMDQVGIPIPDMPEHVASAIMCSEVRPSHISDYLATMHEQDDESSECSRDWVFHEEGVLDGNSVASD